MALSRFRFPDSSPSYTPEFPQGAALNHEPPALPLSYAGSSSAILRYSPHPPITPSTQLISMRVVESPTRRRVVTFVALAGIAAPAFTGVIDLPPRWRTT